MQSVGTQRAAPVLRDGLPRDGDVDSGLVNATRVLGTAGRASYTTIAASGIAGLKACGAVLKSRGVIPKGGTAIGELGDAIRKLGGTLPKLVTAILDLGIAIPKLGNASPKTRSASPIESTIMFKNHEIEA